jgi:outer membrane protein assembly factor BamB
VTVSRSPSWWECTATDRVHVIKRHPKSTHASSTLATDGQHVMAFLGSERLYAYSLSSDLLWKKGSGRVIMMIDL